VSDVAELTYSISLPHSNVIPVQAGIHALQPFTGYPKNNISSLRGATATKQNFMNFNAHRRLLRYARNDGSFSILLSAKDSFNQQE
jgi:hypothetical protein